MATILVIDGDVSFCHSMDRWLIEQGHHVLHADDGADGLQKADLHAVDLVVLDIALSDMDGKGVAAALRTRPHMRRVPIVALTGPDDPVTVNLVKAFGCNGCISKSTDTRILPQQVVTYLEQCAS